MLVVMEVILALVIPFFIIRFRNTKFISMLGITGVSYLLGIIVAVILYLLSLTNLKVTRDTSGIEIVAYVSVAVGIVLLLFSNNLKYVIKLSKKSILSFGLLILSVLISSTIIFIIFNNKTANADILTGMAIGLYTGGTPNSNAIAHIYQLDNNTLLIANISDIIFGGIFYAFLLYFSKPLLKKFLNTSITSDTCHTCNTCNIDITNYENIKQEFKINKKIVRNLIIAIGCVGLSTLAGYLLWMICGKIEGTLTNYLVPAMMIGSTVFGLGLSFIPTINKVEENNTIGQYFVSIFSYSIASMLNLTLINELSLNISLIFIGITIITFIIHLLLCKIFKIDVDLMIVTSTSGIYGPAFVPSITKAINAEYLLSTGLILGSVGYAVGTFLGMGYITILRLFF